jgi:glycosyltransferase involved in cell wall biosynthesis
VTELPLVTVVTSTWQRPRTLRDCALWSVQRQTYPNLQHIVVIDGCDQDTVRMLESQEYTRDAFYHIGQQVYEPNLSRYAELGRNWSTYSGDGGFGATCRLTGAWMAAGELITYLDDDVEYKPGHIESMVAEFEPGVQFVTCHWDGPCAPSAGPPPGLNRTDTSTIMHRAIMLRDHGGFRPDGYAGDGHMVERWLAAGATWKFKDGPATVTHPTGTHNGGKLP